MHAADQLEVEVKIRLWWVKVVTDHVDLPVNPDPSEVGRIPRYWWINVTSSYYSTILP